MASSTKTYLSQLWWLKSKIRCQLSWALWSSLFLADRFCVLKQESSDGSSFSYKDTNPIRRALPQDISKTKPRPNHHPKMHFQIPSHRGLRLHMYITAGNEGAGQIFSPECENCFHISSVHYIHAWQTSILPIFCVCTHAVAVPSSV